MLGYRTIDRALEVRPRHITHVDDPVFERLEAAWSAGAYSSEFQLAWNNGTAFAHSNEGLRGRPPWALEWKGHHRPASRSIESIPADLRVDHVYLISCKYGSEILHNSSPFSLFDHHLQVSTARAMGDWYDHVAPGPYRALWYPVWQGAGLSSSSSPAALRPEDRVRLRAFIESNPVDTNSTIYREFVSAVSEATADRWRKSIRAQPATRELVWRLLRLQAAPYYLLGATRRNEPLRYRVSTPWDFDQAYIIRDFRIAPGVGGQPTVKWQIEIEERSNGTCHLVDGFVEIRWSHGKMAGFPEAKVHLTTNPHHVPGYVPL